MSEERTLKSDKSNYIKPNLGNYPEVLPFGGMTLEKVMDLRYGENPHQNAALYRTPTCDGASIGHARMAYQGSKIMSAINVIDANSAVLIASDMISLHGQDIAVCVPVKHGTPSGVGICYDGDPVVAFERSREPDPLSIFGCTMAVNKPVDMRLANAISDLYLECIVAPSYEPDAKEMITSTKKRIRLVETGSLERIAQMDMEIIPVTGGFVVQQPFYTRINSKENLEVVSKREPTEDEIRALLTQWRICYRIKSNSVVLGDDRQTFGIGTGQMSRVASARIAIYNANEVFGGGGKSKAVGSVGASDAFFPFPDGPKLLAESGMRAIIYPLGSEKDNDTINVWNAHDIAAVCTRPIPGTKEIERAFAGHR
ncbi:hypothetical protein KY363_07490 [Candidatus Woesearchaeota archaeon]|nr:hypothetical protein [Candidatus Woesearchaeota archaeon]